MYPHCGNFVKCLNRNPVLGCEVGRAQGFQRLHMFSEEQKYDATSAPVREQSRGCRILGIIRVQVLWQPLDIGRVCERENEPEIALLG